MFNGVRYSRSIISRHLVLIALVALVMFGGGCSKSARPAAEEAEQTTFATPEDAGNSLAVAVKGDDRSKLVAIFGPGSADLIFSGDTAEDKVTFERFTTAFATMNRWSKHSDGSEVLVVGADNDPFPIPLKRNSAARWYFDTPAGRDEILSRRIGDNELAAIDVVAAIAYAQAEYASQRHGGAKQYAQKIISDDGQQNGLYWKSTEGQPRSPLGPLAAYASVSEGLTPEANQRQPFHGYFYRILTKQGPDAKGGTKDYIANGRMTGGFAVIAYPEKYGDTGIKTFIINQDDEVYERDLGDSSVALAQAITEFDPDPAWYAALD